VPKRLRSDSSHSSRLLRHPLAAAAIAAVAIAASVIAAVAIAVETGAGAVVAGFGFALDAASVAVSVGDAKRAGRSETCRVCLLVRPKRQTGHTHPLPPARTMLCLLSC